MKTKESSQCPSECHPSLPLSILAPIPNTSSPCSALFLIRPTVLRAEMSSGEGSCDCVERDRHTLSETHASRIAPLTYIGIGTAFLILHLFI